MTPEQKKQRESQNRSNQDKLEKTQARSKANSEAHSKKADNDLKAGPVTSSEANKALSKDVAEKYQIVNWPKKGRATHFFMPGFGDINLRTLSVKKAEYLVKNKFPCLEPKKKK